MEEQDPDTGVLDARLGIWKGRHSILSGVDVSIVFNNLFPAVSIIEPIHIHIICSYSAHERGKRCGHVATYHMLAIASRGLCSLNFYLSVDGVCGWSAQLCPLDAVE